MRWIYHVALGERVSQLGPGPEGFVHGSFQPDVRQTVALHLAHVAPRDLRLIRLDPRRLADVRVEGPRSMPHVYGEVPRDAIADVMLLDAIDSAPDAVTGTRLAVVGFAGMTLLDLVGVLDPLARIARSGVDPSASVEVMSLTDAPWRDAGATFAAARVRPPLADFDVLVVAGGPETRALEHDDAAIAWLRTFPETRLATSVCTGALLLGAAGRLRGKRATTHHASLAALARFGATAVTGSRVVRDGMVVTAGGVTSSIDLGLWLVDWLHGPEARANIAARMEYPPPP